MQFGWSGFDSWRDMEVDLNTTSCKKVGIQVSTNKMKYFYLNLHSALAPTDCSFPLTPM
jgi:hypothetical protein